MTTTARQPDPLDAIRGAVVEEVLAIGDDGAAVVLVIVDGSRDHVYQYRRAGQVVAEAANLRALAGLIAPPG